MRKYMSNAMGVAILTLLSQVLGYVREMLFAFYLGTSNAVEAFQVAETVPLLFTQVLISAVPLAVTPLFVREQSENKDDLIHSAIVCFGVVVVFLLIVIWGFPEQFVSAVAPGFQGDKYNVTCRLITILAPNVVFLSIAAVFNSYMNAKQQFIIPAATGLLLNVGIIIMQIATKANVYAVATGAVCGGIAMFLSVYIYCAFKYKLILKMKKISVKNIKIILVAVLPVCFISSFTSINLILDKYFASQLGDGIVATLSYGYKIINLPVYLFVTSVTKVMLPDVTRLLVADEKEQLSGIIRKVIAFCMGGGILAVVAIYVLGNWAVQILFGRGAFNEDDIIATANILKLYSFGIVGMALNSFFQSISYAGGKYFEPFKVLVIQMVIYLIIVVTTIGNLGVNAIVIGNVAAISFSVVLWIMLLKKSHQISVWGRNK